MQELERKLLTDKTSLHSEMAQKIKESADAFQVEATSQLAATSRRALAENVSMSGEVVKLSAQADRLMHRNLELESSLRDKTFDIFISVSR